MKTNDNNNTNSNNFTRYRDTRNSSAGGNNTGNNNNNNNNNNNQQRPSHYEKRRQNQNQNQDQHQSQSDKPQSQQQPQQQQQHYHNQRERSGQRNQSSQQYSDNNANRDHLNLGSVKFTPGLSTRDLPQIETKADPNRKFTGRCRLFVGNLPHNTSEDKLRTLFEKHGEVGEVYLGPKSAFAFVKMDTRQSAEAARDALDCSLYEGRTLRVRVAAHAAAIRVKHLSAQVTNELLAYAFRYFGEIERAVVVVDDKGKSVGEGIVEYSRKQSALYAIKRCQQDCFMLTSSPKPVLVEPYDQQDEDEGLPEKSVNRNAIEFKEQRDVGPRFAEQGTFEHTFALRWKELYAVEKQKRDRLEQEIEEARKNLQDQIEYSRLEHDTMQLRSKLQQLEDNRLKLQQMKEQTMNDSQQREDQRRQQDMMLRQREEEILRRQQLGDPNVINQQETALRMQASALQNLLNSQDHLTRDDQGEPSLQQVQPGSQPVGEADQGMSMGPMTMMGPPQISNQPRTYVDPSMMGISQPFIQVQQQMGMPQPQNPQMNPTTMFPNYMQPQIPQDDMSTSSFSSYPQTRGRAASSQQQNTAPTGGSNRRDKFNRQYSNQSNNISLVQGGRARKRGRY